MFGFPCLKATSTFDLDVLTRLKQACEFKWCVNKSKKPDVERLSKSKGNPAVKRGKGMMGVVKKGKGETTNKDKVGKVVRRTLARRSTSEWGKGGKKVDFGLEEEAEIKQEEDDAPRSRKRKFEQEEEGQTRAMEDQGRARERGGKRRPQTKVAPAANKYIKEEAEDMEEENRGNHGAVAMKIDEESTVEEQSTKTREREVRRRFQTKVALEAQKCSREEAEGGEEKARVAKGDLALRGVEASAVVDVVELPNFQIDQATSLIQVDFRNWLNW